MNLTADKFPDLWTRVLSSVAMVALSVGIFWLGGYWVAAYLTIGVWGMYWEYQRVLRDISKRSPVDLGVMVLTALIAMGVAYIYGWVASVLVLGIGAILLFRRDVVQWLWLSGGVLYIGGAATALLVIFQSSHGLFSVFWILVVVALSDIGGYFAGRLFGGPKLWPAISPKKTWAGTIGGWVLAGLAGLLLGIFGPESIGKSVGISLILTLAAQSGDLLESWLKRRKNVKDASDIIPGHGGLLDRLDGLIAAVLVFFLIQSVFYA